MSNFILFKCPMSHGTMKYTLRAHVCSFVLMVWLLQYLSSLHADIYTNILKIETLGNFCNNGPNILKLIVRVRIYHTCRT